MAEPAPAVAAIDCGTNSTRLLIVDAGGRTLERDMRITRLGEGVDATHKLSAHAIARTVEVLVGYRARMDGHGVARARLVATSAARDAVNADEFFTAAERVTGVRPELLSGDEEGRLSFAGATARLPDSLVGPGPALVVDIGGGSTELAAGPVAAGSLPVPSDDDDGVRAVSLDIGCVRISERFFHHDPPLPGELHDARGAIAGALVTARTRLPALAPGGTLLGLAGTVSTVASLAQGIATYDRSRIHHFVLTKAEVEEWCVRLGSEDHRSRLARPGMVEGRADVIVGGVLVLAAVMDVFDRPTCAVSEDDILDGLVATLRASST